MSQPHPTTSNTVAITGDASLPAARAFLHAIRAKVPGLSIWTDDALLELGADVANLAYSGAFVEVWRLGRSIGLDDFAWSLFCQEVLHGLYPVAFTVPRLPSTTPSRRGTPAPATLAS